MITQHVGSRNPPSDGLVKTSLLGYAATQQRIQLTIGTLKIAAIYHDCHKGVDKPAREIQQNLGSGPCVAVGDWNLRMDKIHLENAVSPPSECKFSVVEVQRSGDGWSFIEAQQQPPIRHTHRNEWIDGALTSGVKEIERIHIRIDALRTHKGQLASDHRPTLLKLSMPYAVGGILKAGVEVKK